MDLVIFCDTGETFRFRNVKTFNVNGKIITFEYEGESTEEYRHATFTDWVGYAYSN